MGKSFDDWFNGREPEPEPKAKEPEKFYDYDAELPAGVDFADEPGKYIYLCRGCDKWKPMDWELNEDSYDSHYCGGSPYCCPMPNVSPGRPVAQKPKRGVPSQLEKKATYFQCAGCGQWHPMSHAHMTKDGHIVCGQYGCVPPERIMPKEPSALEKGTAAHEAYVQMLQNTAVCDGCNKRIPLEKASHHPYSHRPFCGGKDCYHKIAKVVMMAQNAGAYYGPPRAG